MKRAKVISAILLASMLCTTLAGCSGNTTSGQASTNTSQTGDKTPNQGTTTGGNTTASVTKKPAGELAFPAPAEKSRTALVLERLGYTDVDKIVDHTEYAYYDGVEKDLLDVYLNMRQNITSDISLTTGVVSDIGIDGPATRLGFDGKWATSDTEITDTETVLAALKEKLSSGVGTITVPTNYETAYTVEVGDLYIDSGYIAVDAYITNNSDNNGAGDVEVFVCLVNGDDVLAYCSQDFTVPLGTTSRYTFQFDSESDAKYKIEDATCKVGYTPHSISFDYTSIDLSKELDPSLYSYEVQPMSFADMTRFKIKFDVPENTSYSCYYRISSEDGYSYISKADYNHTYGGELHITTDYCTTIKNPKLTMFVIDEGTAPDDLRSYERAKGSFNAKMGDTLNMVVPWLEEYADGHGPSFAVETIIDGVYTNIYYQGDYANPVIYSTLDGSISTQDYNEFVRKVRFLETPITEFTCTLELKPAEDGDNKDINVIYTP